MIYIDPRTMQPVNTRTEPFGRLLRLLRFLSSRHASRRWVEVNGGELALHRYAVALRVEAALRHVPVVGYYLSLLNRFDPPRCRCGAKGTRIIGSVTFCKTCGPPPVAARRFQERRDDYTAESVEIERVYTERDRLAHKRHTLHQVKQHHR